MTGSPRQCPSIPPHHTSLPPALKVMRVEGKVWERWKAVEGEVEGVVVWMDSWEGMCWDKFRRLDELGVRSDWVA